MNDRQLQRPRMTTNLEVRCAETGRPVGQIVDLTTAGMRLVTSEELELETDFHLVISVENDPGATEELRIDARCMWVGRDVNPELHCAGFEFEHVRPRHQALLAQIVQTQRFAYQHA